MEDKEIVDCICGGTCQKKIEEIAPEDQICKCICHEPGGDKIIWDMPHFCCAKCRLCELNIIVKAMDCHKKTCVNSEICQCKCHEPGSDMKHIRQCCKTCQCGDRIKIDCWENHKKHCDEMKEFVDKEARWKAVESQRKEFIESHSGNVIKRL